MSKVIRIGTRDSELALWQANLVKNKLEALGYETVLVPIKSTGDIILDQPLYELGITGIFTKTLDVAMIQGQIDIAVHSMKDVPTQLPKGMVQTAVLNRASSTDILVYAPHQKFIPSNGILATGSLRRKAQWLSKYPDYIMVDLRGNVNTRLNKLQHSNWIGAIFAQAGLERIQLLPNQYEVLDWMIPAPAQGAMMVVAMENDSYSIEATQKLNDQNTQICTWVERQFLRVLEGGCTAPIGCLAEIKEDDLIVKAGLFSLNGSKKVLLDKSTKLTNYQNFGKEMAEEVLQMGGKEILEGFAKWKKDA
ncbi:MAG: hydroxymethylbilane synthase [Flavobacterium sp.]